MKCNLCNKEIVLFPSALERSKKYGESPSYYTNLFKTHADCQISKNKQDTFDLIKRKIEPSIAIENESIVKALIARDDNKVKEILKEEV